MTDNLLPRETVMLDKFASDLGLEMLYAGRGIITLTSISVDRPGLRLAGFFSYFDAARIMLIGLTEHEYMHSFSSEQRREMIKKLFDCGEIPCVIFARDLPVLPEFMECARASQTPIFRTGKMTSSIMVDLCIYLNRLLAPKGVALTVLRRCGGKTLFYLYRPDELAAILGAEAADKSYPGFFADFAAPLKKTARYLDISERGAKIKDEYLFVQNSIIIEFLS